MRHQLTKHRLRTPYNIVQAQHHAEKPKVIASIDIGTEDRPFRRAFHDYEVKIIRKRRRKWKFPVIDPSLILGGEKH